MGDENKEPFLAEKKQDEVSSEGDDPGTVDKVWICGHKGAVNIFQNINPRRGNFMHIWSEPWNAVEGPSTDFLVWIIQLCFISK